VCPSRCHCGEGSTACKETLTITSWSAWMIESDWVRSCQRNSDKCSNNINETAELWNRVVLAISLELFDKWHIVIRIIVTHIIDTAQIYFNIKARRFEKFPYFLYLLFKQLIAVQLYSQFYHICNYMLPWISRKFELFWKLAQILLLIQLISITIKTQVSGFSYHLVIQFHVILII